MGKNKLMAELEALVLGDKVVHEEHGPATVAAVTAVAPNGGAVVHKYTIVSDSGKTHQYVERADLQKVGEPADEPVEADAVEEPAVDEADEPEEPKATEEPEEPEQPEAEEAPEEDPADEAKETPEEEKTEEEAPKE